MKRNKSERNGRMKKSTIVLFIGALCAFIFLPYTGTQNGQYRHWIKTLQVGKRFISLDRSRCTR